MKSPLSRQVWTSILLAFTTVILSPPASALGYDTASGAKPDLQQRQLVDAQTRAFTGFRKICRDPGADGGRHGEIATILADELNAALGNNMNVVSLAAQNDNNDQILIGDLSSSVIAQFAADFGRTTTDLGGEGYNLVAAPNPHSTNGSWVIFLIASSSSGLLNGAYSLVDLLESTAGIVENIRVRDYPDYDVRGLMHWLPQLPTASNPLTVDEWVANQKTSFEQIGGWGANYLGYGRSEFWKMDQQAKDGSAIGARMAETAYWARYYGMEPMPQIGSPLPNAPSIWREGAFVRDEPFHIEADLSTTSVIPPLQNDALGLDFDDDDGGSPPFASGWQQTGNGSWTYGTDANGGYVRYEGWGYQTLRTTTWSAGTLEPGSFYVAECHFDTVTSGIDSYGNTQHMWLGVGGKPAGAPMEWFFHDWLRNGTGIFIKDYYFWTPPSAAQVANDPRYTGYTGVLFEDLTDFRVQIYNLVPFSGPQPIHIKVDEIFLERRNSSLRNVMWTQDTPPDLEFTVTSDDPPGQRTTYVEGVDYSLNYVPSPWYYMPTKRYVNGEFQAEYLSSIQWLKPADAGKDVLVSYTLGVPHDWNAGQQARTWCLKSPAYRESLKALLRKFYEPWSIDPHATGTSFSYTFNPKVIEVNLSEYRGANRCGRCVAANEENSVHFATYIKTHVLDVLDELVSDGYAAAQATDIIVGGIFSPGTIIKQGVPYETPGEQDAYQFRYGGRYGDCAFRNAALQILSSSRRVMLSIGNGNCPSPTNCNGWAYAARELDWPYGYNPPANVFVIANNNSDVGANPEHTASGEGIYDATTWHLPDVAGFYSIGPGYGAEPIVFHEEKEQRLMDYAWRRWSNPDATMQALLGGTYITDDSHAAVVPITQPTVVTFRLFGGAEIRDPSYSNQVLTDATIDWGDGSSTENVFSALNSGEVSHSYWRNSHVATLMVESQPSGGGTAETQTTSITASGPPDDPPPDPQGKRPGGVLFGLRSVSPNPFNPRTTVEFGLSTESEVNLSVYDLRGRRVAQVVAGSTYGPGVHRVAWNGRDDHGDTVASGVYFIHLEAAGLHQSRKILLLD